MPCEFVRVFAGNIQSVNVAAWFGGVRWVVSDICWRPVGM